MFPSKSWVSKMMDMLGVTSNHMNKNISTKFSQLHNRFDNFMISQLALVGQSSEDRGWASLFQESQWFESFDLLAFKEMLNVQSVSGIDISASPLRSSGRRVLLSGSKQEHHGRHSQGLPFLFSSTPRKVGNDLGSIVGNLLAGLDFAACLIVPICSYPSTWWTWPRLGVLKLQKLLIVEVPVPLSPIGLLLEEEIRLVARKPKAQPSTRQQNMVSFKHARCCSCEARGRTACSAGRSSEIWIGPLVHQTLQTFWQELILRPRKGKATEMRYCDFWLANNNLTWLS